jgi:hypothetical protein
MLHLARVVIVTLLLSSVVAPGQNSPSLAETVAYMSNILTQNGDQKLQVKDEACRLYVSDTIRNLLEKPAKTYDTEVQFHLARIDPESVTVDAKAYKTPIVKIEATDFDPVIWESASGWKETHGKIPKSLELFSLPSYNFRFLNDSAARHFAKAFKHAVVLCGGKPSTF